MEQTIELEPIILELLQVHMKGTQDLTSKENKAALPHTELYIKNVFEHSIYTIMMYRIVFILYHQVFSLVQNVPE